MSFQAWRRQLRLTEGLAALTHGEPLASVAAAVGTAAAQYSVRRSAMCVAHAGRFREGIDFAEVKDTVEKLGWLAFAASWTNLRSSL